MTSCLYTNLSKQELSFIGIFAIKNKKDNKLYITSSNRGFYSAYKKHIVLLNSSKHYCKQLQNDWNNIGRDSFEFILIKQVFDVQQMKDEKEKIQKEIGLNCYNPLKYFSGSQIFSPETKTNLNLCGIYGIRNIQTDQIYVGHARKTFLRRATQHSSILKTQSRGNRLLQEAYNEFGKESFEFIILEYLNKNDPLSLFLEKEQFYMDKYKQNRYNLYPIAGSGLNHKNSQKQIDGHSKEYVIVTPNLNILVIKNIAAFCRRNDLHCSSMVRVANNKSKHYKGWIVFHKEKFGLSKIPFIKKYHSNSDFEKEYL